MLFLYFILILAVGYLIASILLGAVRVSLVEVLALSLACGMGGMAFLLFALGLLSFQVSSNALWIVFLITGLSVLVLIKQKRQLQREKIRFDSMSWREPLRHAIPVIVILYCAVVAVWSATKFPLYDWDGFSVWLIKAKTLVHHPLAPVPEEFVDPALAYSHQDYPLAQPLLVAGAWAATGTTDDHTAMLTLVLPWCAIGLLFGAEATRRVGAGAAIWLTALLLAIRTPLLAAPSGSADVLLAAFYLAHLIFVLRWLGGGTIRDCATAGFFAGCMCFTKREGLALSLISVLIMALFAARSLRDRGRHLAFFAGVALICIAPWLIWQTQLLHVTETYYGRLTPSVIQENLARVPTILTAIWNECVSWRAWNGLWILLIAVAILSFEFLRDRTIVALWLLLLGHFIMNALAFFVASDAIFAMMPPVLNRLTLHAFPAAALLILLHWAKLRSAIPPIDSGDVTAATAPLSSPDPA